MKSSKRSLAVSAIALAVQGALAAMAVGSVVAHAEDDEVAALINPTNFIQFGVGGVSTNSNKFGEYNGLHNDDAFVVGNFGIKGGNAFGQGDGTMRWSANGQDLGTTSRSIDASISDQGLWSIGIGYDQLRHYTTTNYQTPYVGEMGGNNFVLPSNFGVINTTKSATGASGGATLIGARSLTATQLGDFNTVDVYSQRENTTFNAGYDFSRNWNFRFDYNHLEQTGAKLTGSGTDPGTARTGAFGGISTWKGEQPITLMTPTQYKTDTFTASVNWTGEKAHATIGYFGSLFHDDYSGITWSNPFQSTNATGSTAISTLPTSTMSTPPSNQFHQLNLTGGYTINQTTKLAGGFSYGVNTQNDSFAGTYTPGFATPPSNSLDGKVVMVHADAKLTNQATKDLTLTAAFKYNERDNQTSSQLYTFYDEGNKLREAWSAPMSNRKTQAELAADYRLTSTQKMHLGYEFEYIERWCDHSPSVDQIVAAATASGQFTAGNLTALRAYYAMGGVSCAQVPDSSEHRLVANYRIKPNDDLSLNAGYTYSDRNATVNASFYNPMQSVTEAFENRGYTAFFQGSRRENMLKSGVNWQATEKLSFGATAKYRYDEYYGSDYGVDHGEQYSLNLDATYAYSENSTVSTFASYQARNRDLNTLNGRTYIATSATNPWSNKLNDDDVTVGINGKQKALLGGRLELNEDLTYSLANTKYNTTVNYASTTCIGTTAAATSNLGCGSPSTIRSELWQLKLSGNYHVDKASSVVLGYTYQHLKSSDYYYNAYQYPYNYTSGLSTNQQAPNYSASMVFVAYQYSFQ
jgi:MtrB/PioB family decaheme-associated outer membrane protein